MSSEIRYRRLFETAQNGILLLNAETGQIEDVNPYLLELLEYSYDELHGKRLWEIDAFRASEVSRAAFEELQAKRQLRFEHLPLQTKEGRPIAVEFVSNVFECEGVDVAHCTIRESVQTESMEMTLRATIRQLKVLSEINTALVGAETEEALLREYCRILVETGGYRMAWVGFAENGLDKRVVPMVHFGHEKGYLGVLRITWADAENGHGPTGTAIRTGKMQCIADIAAAAGTETWRSEALLRGYRTAWALPFHYSEGNAACLTAYGDIPDLMLDSERKLMEEVAADLGFGITTLRTAIAKTRFQEELRASLEQTIHMIVETIDQRDPFTAGHQRRVAHLCVRMGGELGLAEDHIHGLNLAASIHDLGKIGVPAELLAKPGRLSSAQFSLIKEHSQLGYDIVKSVVSPRPIANIILQHHERHNGSGYPQGLMADEILFESKILAVADVVEAISSHRPYRPSLGFDSALKEIVAQRGILFDADVVDSCVHLFREGGYDFPG